MAARRRVDLTEVVSGQPEAVIEFEFHPLGLPGWVAIFDCTLEVPWEEERLLNCNSSYRADRLRAESAIVAARAETVWFREPPAADTYRPYEPPPVDRVVYGELRGLSAEAVAFDPYEEGWMNEGLPLAPDCPVSLELNGAPADGPLLPGDDVELTVEQGRVVRIAARRGSVQGRVQVLEPATAFRLPRLQVEGAPILRVDSRVRMQGRIADRKPASCPLVVGERDFEPGDMVSIRWNPQTERVVEAKLTEGRDE